MVDWVGDRVGKIGFENNKPPKNIDSKSFLSGGDLKIVLENYNFNS